MKVYLSSTKADLEPYREEVSKVLRAPLGFEVVDSYDAATGSVRATCVDDVARCQVYVGLFAWRYGSVPQDGDPEGPSITELEYLRARDTPGMARFLFLLDPVEPWPGDAAHDDTKNSPDGGRKIKALRDRVLADRAALFKAVPADLANKVLRALTRWQIENGAVPAASKPPPRPTLRQPQHRVVPRDDLMGAVVQRLQAGGPNVAFIHLAGVGKTLLAAELLQHPDVQQQFPDGILWASLGPDPDLRRQLNKWAHVLGVADAQIAACDRMDDLRDLVVEAIGTRRMLLVVDDLWTTAAGETFVIGPNCARIFTTRNRAVARELTAGADDIIDVPKLRVEDGFMLLASIAPGAAAQAGELVHRLAERADGLPIALVLVGKLLKLRGDDARAAQAVSQSLREVYDEPKLTEFREERNLTLADVIEISLSELGHAGGLRRGLPGDVLREAVQALAVLRPDPAWFTETLGTLVSGAPAQVLPQLADAGLIEEVRYGLRDDDRQDRYTMHRMIADYLRSKLPRDRLQALNRVAAGHYLEQLQTLEEKYQEGDAASYEGMYRYEDREWQDCQDNWLYYFAQTGDDAEANVAFLRAWFDGFWWWCCFTDEGYDFCDQLISEWGHRLSVAASGDATTTSAHAVLGRRVLALDLLRQFKVAYPKETQDRSGGDWNAVREKLRALLKLSRLDGPADALPSPVARHVRALTGVFLAEADRFGGGDPAAAEQTYRESLALFRELKDDWNTAWVLFHLANFLVDRGRLAEARPLAAEAVTLGEAVHDIEVQAMAWRALGDMALTGHDVAEAQRCYHQAVLCAYRFQVQPKAPDQYTVQLYADLVRFVATRLLRHAVAPEALAIAQGLAAQLSGSATAAPAALEAVDPARPGPVAEAADRLAAALFPPALPVARLKAEGDAYARQVRAQLEAWGEA